MDTENDIGIKEKYSSRLSALLENLSVEEINILLLELSIFLSEYNEDRKNELKTKKVEERGGFVRGIVLDQVRQKDGKTVNYNKLVRDKIPEYLEKIGCNVVFHTVKGDEWKERLKKKVEEEFEEFCINPSEEELADLEEALLAILYFDLK